MNKISELLELIQTGNEVALSMLGGLADILVEIAVEVDRPDLAERIADTLDLSADVLKAAAE